MISGTDCNGRTLIAMAALSGKRAIFDTVLSTVKDELNPMEVLHHLCFSVWLYFHTWTVINSAKPLCATYMLCGYISSSFVCAQVWEMVSAKDHSRRSLLTFAAESPDESIFTALWKYLKRQLKEDEV